MSVPNGVSAGAPVAAAWHCENIGPRQRRRRIRIGVALLVLGGVLAGLLLGLHAERALRLVVAAPFIAGSICLFQVRARTCVVFAARKVKNMDEGEVPVTDSRELQTLLRQARLVWIQGFSLGIVLTVAALVIG